MSSGSAITHGLAARAPAPLRADRRGGSPAQRPHDPGQVDLQLRALRPAHGQLSLDDRQLGRDSLALCDAHPQLADVVVSLRQRLCQEAAMLVDRGRHRRLSPTSRIIGRSYRHRNP
jgi:hypothetical protein